MARTPIHPGEIIQGELNECKISVREAAGWMDISVGELRAILDGKTPVDEDIAAELAMLFDTAAEFWINLQAQYDKRKAKAK